MRFFSNTISIFVFIFCTLFFVSSGFARELKSNVIVLLDFSNSYFTEDRIQNEIPRNIKQISELIASDNDGPKKPSLIQVLPINSISEVAKPICEYRIQRKKLIGGKDKDCGTLDDAFCSAKEEEFLSYINEDCMARVQKITADTATDISGALALASQIGISQTEESRYLVIFSDMFEYRHENLPVSQIDLSGFNILVVCGGYYNTEKDSAAKLCISEQPGWKARFEQLGAKNVYSTNETGQWANKTGKDFFGND